MRLLWHSNGWRFESEFYLKHSEASIYGTYSQCAIISICFVLFFLYIYVGTKYEVRPSTSIRATLKRKVKWDL